MFWMSARNSMKPPNFSDTISVDGVTVSIRPMRPEDRENERRFVQRLSPQSRYFRFHAAIKELSATMLEHFTNVNYPNEMALVAMIPEGDDERQIGVARYVRLEDPKTAEFAIVIADEWQGKGIGTRLLLDLRSCAIAAGITQLKASVLSENRRMYEFCRKLGFEVEPRHNDYSTVELGKRFEGNKFAGSGS
jgi:acetyltransferase